jgi:hypothetical protein
MRKLIIALSAALMLLLGLVPAHAIGKQHFATNAITLTNQQNPDEHQKVVLYVNMHDLTQQFQAIFNYDTDEGPCGAARIYIENVTLWGQRSDTGQWFIDAETNPQRWYSVGGTSCPGDDLFINTPWNHYLCKNFQTEAVFKIDWGLPANNIGPMLYKFSDVAYSPNGSC